MSGGSGGYAVSKARGGDRFYSPPAVRRQQQLLQQEKLQRQQQQQLPRPVKSAAAAPAKAVVEAENRTDSDESTSTLSKPPSVCSSSPPRLPSNATNLDRLMESVTPFVRAQYQANSKGRRTPEYYCLEDLWETFREWSVYGAGVPLLLNGEDPIMQYYVPYLSGIQLYADPAKAASKLRRPGEESDVESLRETSSGGSSDYEADRSLMNVNSQRINRLSLRDKSVISSSSEEAEISTSPGTLVFEYLEHEPPHNRKPLTDKVSFLANQFPDLRKYRSCDLSPSSWICVAWYPIYRIPMGSTLKDLDASFLSFHSLSTHSKSSGIQGTSGRTVHGDASLKIPVPAFGLASYKLKGSILTPSGPHECQQENFLLQAADTWLQRLQAFVPDYQFFRSHYSQWRQWGDELPSSSSSNNCVAPARGKKFEVSIGVNSVAS